MRLDHLLSKESGRHGYRSNRCLVQGETESRLILFNFEGPEKGTQKSETLCEERGGVAQLGEHLLCKQGVRSSILLISTKGRRKNEQLEVSQYCGVAKQQGDFKSLAILSRYAKHNGRIAQVVRAHA